MAICEIEQCFWPKRGGQDVWMIVDAARDERIFGMLLGSFYSRHSCLFSAHIPTGLEVAAPYLVQLEYGDPGTQRLISHAWGNSWGVFLRCDARPESLRRHLRELLIVRDPKGTRLLFRYYDPRVLKLFLPMCTLDELRVVFGPVSHFFIEDAPDLLLDTSLTRGELVIGHQSISREPNIGFVARRHDFRR